MSMANIYFYRQHHYFGLFGKWEVFINNKIRLSLLPDDNLEINLKPNTYKIQIKSGALKSNIINLKVHDKDKVYFLIFIDIPYWKKLPFIFLYFYFKQGGLLKIIKIDKKDFSEKTQDKTALIWVNNNETKKNSSLKAR